MYLQFTFSNSQTIEIQRLFWQIFFLKEDQVIMKVLLIFLLLLSRKIINNSE